MKPGILSSLVAIISSLILVSDSIGHVIVFEQDFESGSNPPWFRQVSGDSGFLNMWDMSAGLVESDGTHYARYEAVVDVLPENPAVRWFGGYRQRVQPEYELPAEWSVSFDFRTESLDPVRIRILLSDGAIFRPGPPFGGLPDEESLTKLYFSWVYPASTGWNRATIESGQFTEMTLPHFREVGTFLEIGMASHDPDGNPLELGSVGVHEMNLNNITFSVIPEPRHYGALIGAGIFMLLFARRFAGRRLSIERDSFRPPRSALRLSRACRERNYEQDAAPRL